MKTNSNPIALCMLCSLMLSCTKNDTISSVQSLKSSDKSSAIHLSDTKEKMKQQMKPQDFKDLDWPTARLNSLDKDHPNSLMKVQSKTTPNKALYYSMIDGIETAYLVTVNLPSNITDVKKVNGSVVVESVDGIVLRKITIEKNKAIGIINYDLEGRPLEMSNLASDFTLPDVVVIGYIYNTMLTVFKSLVYTYGGGLAWYTPFPTWDYGGGGSFNNPMYDKYEPENGGDVFVDPFVNKIPSQVRARFIAKVVKYATYDQWTVVDNKSWTTFNVTVTFRLDKNFKLIPDKTSVKVTGLIVGTLKVDPMQNPDAIYGRYGSNSMSFQIQSTWSYGFGSTDVPLSINIDDVQAAHPSVGFTYFNMY